MLDLTVADVSLILLGYILGSVSSAIITARVMGLPDPRLQGSGNPGATNMLRIGGKKAAAITLFGDMLKGLIPVALAQLLTASIDAVALVGLAAFLGHLYPIFFGFRGGKGVATGLGVLLAASWKVGLATAGTWLLMAATFHISSLSALTAFVLSPFYAWWLQPQPMFIGAVTVMSVLLLWRHRSNIRKLLRGTEDKVHSG